MFKVLPLVLFLAITQASIAEEISAQKKQVIDEMLEVTGAVQIAETMGTAIANQMITAMSQQEQLSSEVEAIIREEAQATMQEGFIDNRFVHEMSYEIYHKHFTIAELKEIVAFYKTPTGSKVTNLLPQITQEGMLKGQKQGESLVPVLQKRILARFKEEGIM